MNDIHSNENAGLPWQGSVAGRPRYKIIACEILYREICAAAAVSPAVTDPVFMPKGLHDIGAEKMRLRLQAVIDAVDSERYDAILLVYGLCNLGVQGLTASIPLVIPRAHDCITLLMGSRAAYQAYFDQHHGTYFKSPGWIEREATDSLDEQTIPTQLGINHSYQEYVDQYGEENAEYLMSVLGDWLHQYQRLTYIDTGTGSSEVDIRLTAEQTAACDWEFETIYGYTILLRPLLNGDWDSEDFLVIRPQEQIAVTFGPDIIAAVPISDHSKRV